MSYAFCWVLPCAMVPCGPTQCTHVPTTVIISAWIHINVMFSRLILGIQCFPAIGRIIYVMLFMSLQILSLQTMVSYCTSACVALGTHSAIDHHAAQRSDLIPFNAWCHRDKFLSYLDMGAKVRNKDFVLVDATKYTAKRMSILNLGRENKLNGLERKGSRIAQLSSWVRQAFVSEIPWRNIAVSLSRIGVSLLAITGA